MDFEAVWEELLVAVLAGDLVGQAVLAKLILDDAVGGEHHISLGELLHSGLPLVTMIHHHLHQALTHNRTTTIAPSLSQQDAPQPTSGMSELSPTNDLSGMERSI